MPKSQFSHVLEWVFDMDHTLYPPHNKLFDQIEILMADYFVKVTGLQKPEADKLRQSYWDKYGASLTGLMHHHEVDPADFLRDVHDIDFSVLDPDHGLNDIIRDLPGRKIVYTNAPRAYAEQTLDRLHMQDMFDAVYALEDADLIPKPNQKAYDIVLNKAGVDPNRAAMFEDSPQNLRVPHDIGMRTVLVHGECRDTHIHHHTPNLSNFLNQLVTE
jgi:putative hydrolase of the HAD superfamily